MVVGGKEETGAGRGCRSMSNLLDSSIAALRTNHDQLATLVADAGPDDLTRPSGATASGLILEPAGPAS